MTTADTKPYRVLARKYRPADFTGLIGQDAMVRTLANAFAAGRIPQAWMLTGVRGVGKTTTARILARALNYRSAEIDRPTIDLAVEGTECRAIIEGRHVDVVEMDAASNTGIDDMKQIIEGVRYAPLTARFKVYIIDEVHMISEKAFNALLKTLEEPPAHAKFIFATTEIRKVPVTILSRCQRFDLRRVDASELAAHLARICTDEGVSATPEALAMIARAGDGSVRDALSILDQAIAHGAGGVEAGAVRDMLGLADRARIIDLFGHLVKGDIEPALAELASQHRSGAQPVAILGDLAAFTHLVTRLRVAPAAAGDSSLGEAERERGRALAAELSVPVLSRLWQMLMKGMGEVDAAPRPLEAAEMVLIRIAHAAHLPSLEDALKAVSDGAPAARGGTGVHPPAAAPDMHAQAVGEASGTVSQDRASPYPPAQAPRAMSGPNGPAAAPRLSTQPAQEDAAPHDVPRISSITDILALADRHRDIQFKVFIKQYVRPVAFGDGRLEIALEPGAPKTLYNDISRRLEMWTGNRWLVIPSNESGEATVAELEAGSRKAAENAALDDPAVAAIMRRLPGTRIVGVSLRSASGDAGADLKPDGMPETLADEDGSISAEPDDTRNED